MSSVQHDGADQHQQPRAHVLAPHCDHQDASSAVHTSPGMQRPLCAPPGTCSHFDCVLRCAFKAALCARKASEHRHAAASTLGVPPDVGTMCALSFLDPECKGLIIPVPKESFPGLEAEVEAINSHVLQLDSEKLEAAYREYNVERAVLEHRKFETVWEQGVASSLSNFFCWHAHRLSGQAAAKQPVLTNPADQPQHPALHSEQVPVTHDEKELAISFLAQAAVARALLICDNAATVPERSSFSPAAAAVASQPKIKDTDKRTLLSKKAELQEDAKWEGHLARFQGDEATWRQLFQLLLFACSGVRSPHAIAYPTCCLPPHRQTAVSGAVCYALASVLLRVQLDGHAACRLLGCTDELELLDCISLQLVALVISWSTCSGPWEAAHTHNSLSHVPPLRAPFPTHDLVSIATVLWDYVLTGWCCAYPGNARRQVFEAPQATLRSRRRQLACVPIASLTEHALSRLDEALQHIGYMQHKDQRLPPTPCRSEWCQGTAQGRRWKELAVRTLAHSITAAKEGHSTGAGAGNTSKSADMGSNTNASSSNTNKSSNNNASSGSSSSSSSSSASTGARGHHGNRSSSSSSSGGTHKAKSSGPGTQIKDLTGEGLALTGALEDCAWGVHVLLSRSRMLGVRGGQPCMLRAADDGAPGLPGLATAVTLLEIALAEMQMGEMHGSEYKSSALHALICLRRGPFSKAKPRMLCPEAAASAGGLILESITQRGSWVQEEQEQHQAGLLLSQANSLACSLRTMLNKAHRALIRQLTLLNDREALKQADEQQRQQQQQQQQKQQQQQQQHHNAGSGRPPSSAAAKGASREFWTGSAWQILRDAPALVNGACRLVSSVGPLTDTLRVHSAGKEAPPHSETESSTHSLQNTLLLHLLQLNVDWLIPPLCQMTHGMALCAEKQALPGLVAAEMLEQVLELTRQWVAERGRVGFSSSGVCSADHEQALKALMYGMPGAPLSGSHPCATSGLTAAALDLAFGCSILQKPSAGPFVAHHVLPRACLAGRVCELVYTDACEQLRVSLVMAKNFKVVSKADVQRVLLGLERLLPEMSKKCGAESSMSEQEACEYAQQQLNSAGKAVLMSCIILPLTHIAFFMESSPMWSALNEAPPPALSSLLSTASSGSSSPAPPPNPSQGGGSSREESEAMQRRAQEKAAEVSEAVYLQGQNVSKWLQEMAGYQQQLQAHPDDLSTRLKVFNSLYQYAEVCGTSWRMSLQYLNSKLEDDKLGIQKGLQGAQSNARQQEAMLSITGSSPLERERSLHDNEMHACSAVFSHARTLNMITGMRQHFLSDAFKSCSSLSHQHLNIFSPLLLSPGLRLIRQQQQQQQAQQQQEPQQPQAHPPLSPQSQYHTTTPPTQSSPTQPASQQLEKAFAPFHATVRNFSKHFATLLAQPGASSALSITAAFHSRFTAALADYVHEAFTPSIFAAPEHTSPQLPGAHQPPSLFHALPPEQCRRLACVVPQCMQHMCTDVASWEEPGNSASLHSATEQAHSASSASTAHAATTSSSSSSSHTYCAESEFNTLTQEAMWVARDVWQAGPEGAECWVEHSSEGVREAEHMGEAQGVKQPWQQMGTPLHSAPAASVREHECQGERLRQRRRGLLSGEAQRAQHAQQAQSTQQPPQAQPQQQGETQHAQQVQQAQSTQHPPHSQPQQQAQGEAQHAQHTQQAHSTQQPPQAQSQQQAHSTQQPLRAPLLQDGLMRMQQEQQEMKQQLRAQQDMLARVLDMDGGLQLMQEQREEIAEKARDLENQVQRFEWRTDQIRGQINSQMEGNQQQLEGLLEKFQSQVESTKGQLPPQVEDQVTRMTMQLQELGIQRTSSLLGEQAAEEQQQQQQQQKQQQQSLPLLSGVHIPLDQLHAHVSWQDLIGLVKSPFVRRLALLHDSLSKVHQSSQPTIVEAAEEMLTRSVPRQLDEHMKDKLKLWKADGKDGDPWKAGLASCGYIFCENRFVYLAHDNTQKGITCPTCKTVRFCNHECLSKAVCGGQAHCLHLATPGSGAGSASTPLPPSPQQQQQQQQPQAQAARLRRKK